MYADTRRLLAEELGVDPRPELAELHQRILQADAGAGPPGRRAGARPPRAIRPAQLPATVPDFTGRAAFVRELGDRLASAEGAVMAVSALAGIGGVGKTTLAVHVAHAGPAASPTASSTSTSRARARGRRARGRAGRVPARARHPRLGDPRTRWTSGPRSTARSWRPPGAGAAGQRPRRRPGPAAAARPPGCAALVTSRVRMVDLAGARLVDLDVMEPEEALLLFTRIVGAERVAAEREAAMDVVAACGFLPLAIRIAASRLAARRTWTVSVLGREAGRRAPPAGRAAGGRPRREGDLRPGVRPARAGPGPRVPAARPGGRPRHLARRGGGRAGAGPARRRRSCWRRWSTPACWSPPPPAATASTTWCGSTRVTAPSGTSSAAERESALSRLLDYYLATAARVYAMERPGDRIVDHLEPTGTRGWSSATARTRWTGCTRRPLLLACVQQAAVRRRRAAPGRRPAVAPRTWPSPAPTPSGTRPPPAPCRDAARAARRRRTRRAAPGPPRPRCTGRRPVRRGRRGGRARGWPLVAADATRDQQQRTATSAASSP